MDYKNLKFDENSLFVFDFSAVVNIKSHNELEKLSTYILENKIDVAISEEFFENYEVVIKSQNKEQQIIAKMTYEFLNALEKNKCLMHMSEIINPTEIINQLYSNPRVCFIYYKNSEFSQKVMEFYEKLKCKCIIVDEQGNLNFCNDKLQIKNQSLCIIDDDIQSDDYFSIKFVPEFGAQVKTKDNEYYKLGHQIDRGGEGTIYDCSKKGYVIKIYHDKMLNLLRLKKIMMMEKKQICYDGLCWPEKVVYDINGNPIGYMMKKIVGKSLDFVFDGCQCVVENFPMWKKENLINLAIDILQKIQYLHLFGIIIGDLRFKNIIISDDGIPSLVDLDSCQIDNIPSPTGYSDFTPPELQKVEFKKQLRTYENENFSCAVLVFKILFCGAHPYDQKNGADTIEEEIAKMSFPYPESITGDYSKIPFGDYNNIWDFTPVQMQNVFTDIFKYGKRYSIQELILMLKTYKKFIDIKGNKMPALNKIVFSSQLDLEELL